RIRARVFDQHLNKYVTKDVVDWENVTRSEAYRFIAGWREFRGGRFGVPHTPLSTALATYVAPGQTRPILESIFFPNAPLAGEARRRSDGDKYEPITVTGISDGDTIKVRIGREGCATEEGSIRFAGIDTPEKFRSDAKFWPQHEAVMADLVDRGLVKPGEVGRNTPLGVLLANRMEYGGAVSSLIMKDFLSYALARKGKFALEVTYNRVVMKGDDAAACDAASLYDVYLRSIWVLRVENPSLVTDYLSERLAQMMEGKAPRHSAIGADDGGRAPKKEPSDGVELWESYQLTALKDKAKPEDLAKLEAAEKQLAKWRAEGRTELADLLDPAKIPQPSALYSKAGVVKIQEIWNGFVAKHPDRAGDVNAFMVGLGAAYAYTKYLNDMSDEYLKLG
ncbi:MAG TPA: hypothetical protein PLY45_06325, partial [bacterium]|nr:hypothetical protein [bacterium]